MMKKLLGVIVFIIIPSGCAGPQDGVLSSLLMVGVVLAIMIISAIVLYTIKATKLLVGITPDVEKKNEKKQAKKNRKKHLEEISDDRKFIKNNYQQYVKNYQRKYPNSKHYLSRSGWNNEVAKVKQRIKSLDREKFLTKKYKKMYKSL